MLTISSELLLALAVIDLSAIKNSKTWGLFLKGCLQNWSSICSDFQTSQYGDFKISVVGERNYFTSSAYACLPFAVYTCLSVCYFPIIALFSWQYVLSVLQPLVCCLYCYTCMRRIATATRGENASISPCKEVPSGDRSGYAATGVYESRLIQYASFFFSFSFLSLYSGVQLVCGSVRLSICLSEYV